MIGGSSERGAALITVIVVLFLMSALFVLSVSTSDQSIRSSVRDRNWELALGVAEAGVDRAIELIDASGGTFTGEVADAGYTATVTRVKDGFEIDSTGTFGVPGGPLERRRRVRVKLLPPGSFPETVYAFGDLVVRKNGTVIGDIWANRSITLENLTTVHGSVVSAQSWIDLQEKARVVGDVWSGGYTTGFAVRLENGARVDQIDATSGGSVTASTAGCPTLESPAQYKVAIGNETVVARNLTTWGEKSGGGAVAGVYAPFTCTTAAPPVPMPTFTYSSANYDPAPREFVGEGAVARFNTLKSSMESDFHGVFYVQDASPSQSNRIDLDRVVISGDTTIITNAPVFTNGVTDTATPGKRFIVVTTYTPPTGTVCSEDQDASECALHIKNNFRVTSGDCPTTVLMYAENGPAAVKNSATYCGAIYAQNLTIKNGLTLVEDASIVRVPGFGGTSYVRARFEELPPGG